MGDVTGTDRLVQYSSYEDLPTARPDGAVRACELGRMRVDRCAARGLRTDGRAASDLGPREGGVQVGANTERIEGLAACGS